MQDKELGAKGHRCIQHFNGVFADPNPVHVVVFYDSYQTSVIGQQKGSLGNFTGMPEGIQS
jgi:hypothetical protein